MATAKTSVKSAPKSVGAKAKPRGAEQRYHVARRASILLKHVSDPTRLAGHLDPGRRRAARRRLVFPAQPEPARGQPSPGSLAARRSHRPAPTRQEQLLQPYRNRRRPGQGGQELDRLKAFHSQHNRKSRRARWASGASSFLALRFKAKPAAPPPCSDRAYFSGAAPRNRDTPSLYRCTSAGHP